MIIEGGLHGAYTHRMARDELGDGRLRTAVETGELVGFGRGVLLDARRVLDLRTRAAGALLLTGGVIVGPSAAALHGCTAVSGFPVHVRVPYGRRIRSRLGLVVHQGDMPARDVVVVDGLRVLAVEQAVADLLCGASRRAALACADQVLREQRPEDRAEFLAEVRRRLAARADRRGTRQAELLLELATGLPETEVQSGFVLMFADCGFPPPVCQYEVGHRRLDFAWPRRRVALECGQGEAGDVELRALGWQVLHADEQDLVDPTRLYPRLRAALGSRRAAA